MEDGARIPRELGPTVDTICIPLALSSTHTSRRDPVSAYSSTGWVSPIMSRMTCGSDSPSVLPSPLFPPTHHLREYSLIPHRILLTPPPHLAIPPIPLIPPILHHPRLHPRFGPQPPQHPHIIEIRHAYPPNHPLIHIPLQRAVRR